MLPPNRFEAIPGSSSPLWEVVALREFSTAPIRLTHLLYGADLCVSQITQPSSIEELRAFWRQEVGES
jgi:hypothetical protein